MVYKGLFLFDSIDKTLGRLKGRNVVCRNGHRGLARDVAGGLLGTVLDDETAETPELHGISCDDGALHHIGKFFYHSHYLGFLDAGSLCYFVYNLCLSHSFYSFLSFGLFDVLKSAQN